MGKNPDSITPVNQLICFVDTDTGIKLCELSAKLISRTHESSITLLQLMNKEQTAGIDNFEKYKNDTFQSTIELCKNRGITIRIFVKISENFLDDIVNMIDEFGYNFRSIGIHRQIIDDSAWPQNMNLQNNESPTDWKTSNANDDDVVAKKNDIVEKLSSLLNRVMIMTGIFINKDFEKMNHIFIPLLDNKDIPLFRFVNSFSTKEVSSVITWDAVGIIENNPDLKKMYRDKLRSSDGKFTLWDTNKKIDCNFIEQQDLMIIGLESWCKLIGTALSWFHALPSTLIIKDKTD
jgi:hypothetical protein